MAGELRDFYFSWEMSQCLQRSARLKGERFFDCLFKGKEFTVSVTHGKDHGCGYPDMEFVGTGSDSDVQYIG